MNLRKYDHMGIQINTLIAAESKAKSRIQKGDINNALIKAEISEIQDLSQQLGDGFNELKADFDNNRISLDFYFKRLNVLYILLNSGITVHDDNLQSDAIRKEFARINKIVNPPTPEIQQPVKKATVSKPIVDPFAALKKSQAGLDKALSDLDKFAKSLPKMKRVS